MDLYRQTEFPDNSNFLIVDKLIHGSVNREFKKKLMAKGKNVTTKECLEIMRQFESVEATMKKLETLSDTQVDGSYVLDPTKKSQRNGYKSKPHRPKNNNNLKESLAFGVINAHTLVANVQLKMPRSTSAKSKGISSELAYVEKHVQDQKRTIKMTNERVPN